jgi:hypothetical protein
MQAPTTAAVFAALAIIAGAAPGVTKFVDLCRNVLDKGQRAPKWTWNVIAFVAGEVVAFVSHLDAASMLLPPKIHVARWLTMFVTGIAIGGASGYFHELFDKLSSQAKAAVAVDPEQLLEDVPDAAKVA